MRFRDQVVEGMKLTGLAAVLWMIVIGVSILVAGGIKAFIHVQ